MLRIAWNEIETILKLIFTDAIIVTYKFYPSTARTDLREVLERDRAHKVWSCECFITKQLCND